MRRVDVDVAEIVRLYTSGVRASAIARRLGCSEALVYGRLSEAGVPRSREAQNVVLDRDGVIRLYLQERWSTIRIADEYGVAPQTIARHLRLWGVPVRSRTEAKQPFGRCSCPVSGPLRSYLLGFVWGDLAVEKVSDESLTVSVRGSTTHEAQRTLVDELFSSFGPVHWSHSATSSCVRVSLDRSFDFLFEKYQGRVPAWITGAEQEAAFAAGYIDAEGSFGIYEGRARFKLDSYDAEVHTWLGAWLQRSGVGFRQRIISRKGDARSDGGVFNGDLWRTNVNESFALLRLAATLDPYLRHARRRERMDAAVANVRERLRSRALL